MIASTTRRQILGGLATVPALAGLPAAAVPADPAIDLARRAAEAEKAWDAADVAEDELVGEYFRRQPPVPEALFERPLDFSVGLLGCGSRHESGRRWYGDRDTLDDLRQPQLRRDVLTETEEQVVYRPDPAKQARADEIVAAYDGWVRQTNEVADELGLNVAYERSEALLDAYHEVLGHLLRTPATTMAGIIAKARFCGHMFDGGAEEAFADDENRTTFERVTHSVVRDLLALQGRA